MYKQGRAETKTSDMQSPGHPCWGKQTHSLLQLTFFRSEGHLQAYNALYGRDGMALKDIDLMTKRDHLHECVAHSTQYSSTDLIT